MKITLLKIMLLFGGFLFLNSVTAQTVSGTVSDASGPLPGASVLVKGTTNGTQTDFDGNYTLNDVDSGATLVFSYIGFKTEERAVNGQSTVNVTLSEDAQALDEVVIIGYGSTTIKDATGSVAAVTAEDFNGGVIASPEQLIQGKTAGVQITQSSGAPGAGVALRIRGTTSVRSNNNPLFVVDGIPLTSDTQPEATNTGFGTSTSSNPLNFLNPNDIESISILKDASATAIYGSRGANGVVIITTKSGRAGSGGTFEYSSTVSVSSPANEYDLLGREDFLQAVDDFGGNAAEQDFGANTNWQDVVTRTVASHNQNLAYSHNYGDGNVRATFGYGEQYGIVQNSDLDRLTFRVNAAHRFMDDRLRLNVQATYSDVNQTLPALSGSAGFQGDLLGAAYSANPTWPDDPTFQDTGGLITPRVLLDYTLNTSETERILLNGSAEFDIVPELTAKINLGYDKADVAVRSASSALAQNLDRGTFGNGRGGLSQLYTENRLLEATLNYKQDLGNSRIDALVGFSYQDFGRSGRTVRGWGFGTTNLAQMNNDLEDSANAVAGTVDGSYQQFGYAPNTNGVFINRLFPEIVQEETGNTVSGANVASLFADHFDNTDELQSFFARVNYTINDKYLFTATVRADGSSRFGGDNQYGVFPSGAFAWKINEEDFVGDNVSTLKLRLNYGITGNQDGLGYGNFINRTRFDAPDQVITDGGEINIPGTRNESFANPELKWEETTQYGAGIDFGFNNDRLTGTIDVYRKETKDLLLQVQAAQPSPQPFFFQNLDATVINQGVEFALNYDFIQTEDVTFSAGFNVAYNDNEIQDFGGLIPAGTIRGQGLSQAFSQLLAGGQPLFSFFVREFEGFDEDGQPIGDTQTFVGESALPDVTGGLSLNLNVKNWDFSTYFTGQFGASVYNNTRNAFFTAGAIANARNVTPDVVTSGEAGSAEAAVSTRFLENADFIRLQNAAIGYNVPLSGEGLFKSLRLSLTGQNLFLITDYSGIDPEVSVEPASGIDTLNNLPVAGIDYTAFPRPRTVTFGINASF